MATSARPNAPNEVREDETGGETDVDEVREDKTGEETYVDDDGVEVVEV